MRQNQDWSARLFSISYQITGGTVALLASLLAAAIVFTLGLRGLLDHARWQARVGESAARLRSVECRLSGDFAAELRSGSASGRAFRGQAGTLNLVADDLARLHDLCGDNAAQAARLRRVQEIVDRWRGSGEQSGSRQRARLSAQEADEMLDQAQALLADVSRARERQAAERLRAAEQLGRRTLLHAGGITLLAAALALSLSRRLARRLVDPLRQMMLAAERLTLGDVAPRVEDTRRDEVGQLARAFNKMAAHVHQREAASRARNRELDDLHYFNSLLQTSSCEEEIHRALLQKVRSLNVSQAVILDRDVTENTLAVVASLHPLPGRDFADAHLTPLTSNDAAASAATPLCRVVRAGKEVVVPDIAEDLMCADCRFGQQRGSAFCAPITAGGHTIGALHLSSSQTDYWTGERQRLVKALVDQAAPAINNLRLMERLRNSALVDEQTQVYNRRFLDGYLRQQLANAERQGRPLGVMMLDIDHFKRFNDQYGHEAGDFVLREFARAVSGALREGELVARYGGEEFTVVMQGTAREALTLAERLRRAVAELSFAQFTKNGEAVRVTMSVGIADFPTSGRTPEEVLKAADVALYRAKSDGRNCVKLASRSVLAVRAGAKPGR
jgi:diguanylate cyclase (GGDEF)-like protein